MFFGSRGGEKGGGAVKRSIRRVLALACALVMALAIIPQGTKAVLSGVYFTAVNDELLDLRGDTMPFWSGGHLYVSNAIFTGIYGSSLGIRCASNAMQQTAVVFSNRQALTFDLAAGTAQDSYGNPFSAKAIQRGGYIFFPIDQIASYFGVSYSYLRTDTVPLVRVKSNAAALTDDMFLDAASNMMATRYAAYERSIVGEESSDEEDPPQVYTGKRVYLILDFSEAADTTRALDLLAARDSQATFVMTVEEMEENHDLLRRLVGMGHAVAIRAETPAQAERGNEILWTAAHAVTRLVMTESGEKNAFAREGYQILSWTVDSSDRPLSGVTGASALYSRLTAMSRSEVSVYLGAAGENTGGLDNFLSRLERGDSRCLAWRATL